MKRADCLLKSRYVFLSHPLSLDTPSYGGKEKLEIQKISDIKTGAVSNHTKISMSVHLGTHIDFPAHFFENSLSVEDFDANFFVFDKPLLISIEPVGKVIGDELIQKLERITDEEYDILLVKTGDEGKRGSDEYFLSNCGFAPKVADFLRDRFASVRVLGFDTVSVSSFTDRMVGREAHRAFLEPKKPILLLEDMSLDGLDGEELKKVTVSPLRLVGSDGAPCTVIGELA
jgi:arylformamidase